MREQRSDTYSAYKSIFLEEKHCKDDHLKHDHFSRNFVETTHDSDASL